MIIMLFVSFFILKEGPMPRITQIPLRRLWFFDFVMICIREKVANFDAKSA